MKNPIQAFLNEPYPFYYESKILKWLLPSVFIIGTLFLYIFQPFNNNWAEHKYPFLIICMIHSATALLCLLPFFLLANYFINDKSTWTVIKELVLMFFAFLAVGAGNYFIRDYIYNNDYDEKGNYNCGSQPKVVPAKPRRVIEK